MPSVDREITEARTYVVTTSHNAAGDVLYRSARQLVGADEDLHLGTVAQEAAEARQRRAHLGALIEDLEPVIGRERYIALDTAIGNALVAVRMEYLSRLVHLGIEALDTHPPGLLVLSPTVRSAVAQTAPAHSPDTCRCCRARWRPRVWRILASIAAAFALGAVLSRRRPDRC